MSTTQPRALARWARWRVAAASAAVVTGVVVLACTPTRAETTAAIALRSEDAIAIAQGVSVTPAPGWTLGHRGPNWVALNNADTTAQLRITIKPAGGTDAA